MDTNQTDAGQNEVGATIDATQAAEVGGAGCGMDDVKIVADNPGMIGQAFDNFITGVVDIAMRVTGKE